MLKDLRAGFIMNTKYYYCVLVTLLLSIFIYSCSIDSPGDNGNDQAWSPQFAANKQTVQKEAVLGRLNSATKAIHSVQYEVSYVLKLYRENDTTSLKGACWLERFPEDTVIGRKVKMIHESGYIRYYDGNDFFSLDPKKRKAIIENPRTSNNKPFRGNIWDHLIFEELLDGIPTERLNELNISYLLEKRKDKDSYHVLKFLLPDSGEFTGYIRLWMSKVTFLPIKMISEVEFQGNTQYSEIAISKLVVDAERTSKVLSNFTYPIIILWNIIRHQKVVRFN